jgi:hypothetical protein
MHDTAGLCGTSHIRSWKIFPKWSVPWERPIKRHYCLDHIFATGKVPTASGMMPHRLLKFPAAQRLRFWSALKAIYACGYGKQETDWPFDWITDYHWSRNFTATCARRVTLKPALLERIWNFMAPSEIFLFCWPKVVANTLYSAESRSTNKCSLILVGAVTTNHSNYMRNGCHSASHHHDAASFHSEEVPFATIHPVSAAITWFPRELLMQNYS